MADYFPTARKGNCTETRSGSPTSDWLSASSGVTVEGRRWRDRVGVDGSDSEPGGPSDPSTQEGDSMKRLRLAAVLALLGGVALLPLRGNVSATSLTSVPKLAASGQLKPAVATIGGLTRTLPF